MPNYVCRWPDGSLTIAAADSENELFYVLDEVGDPTSVEVHEQGIDEPLAIHFRIDGGKLLDAVLSGDSVHSALTLEGLSESLFDAVNECYPVLEKTLSDLMAENLETKESLATLGVVTNAVAKECERPLQPNSLEIPYAPSGSDNTSSDN